jgi:hypothetical protein
MTYRSLPSVIGVFVLIGLAFPGLAYAQGQGRPKAPRGSSPTTTTPTSPSASSSAITSTTIATAPTAVSVSTYRQFGAWLDDASAAGRGEGYTSIGVGHWRMLGSSQTNLPMLGVGIGVTDRMQVGASVPFYRASYEGGSASGMDDVYLSGKYTLVDPTLTLSEFGLAISPTMEVLSAGTPDGRVHFAVPVSLELRRQPFRVYGSAGLFTRGSFFSGAALEWSAPGGTVLSGAFTQSYSLKDDEVLDSMGIGRQRMDVSLGVAHALGTTAAAFVNVGRSLTSVDEGGTSLALSGGLSFTFNTITNP